jgi:hypothetical protein
MTPLLALGLTACGKEMAVKEIDTLAQAKSDLYESAAELESAATLVVRVERTETAENVIKSLGIPDAWYGYTLSMVKVNEIMKNTSGRDIAIGDEIRVLENQFTYVDDENTRVTCHVDQYKMMEPGNEYFLYSYYSENDEWYVILSGLLGKVPVLETEDVLFPIDKITFFQNQAVEDDDSYTRELLEDIRRECLEKYNQ